MRKGDSRFKHRRVHRHDQDKDEITVQTYIVHLGILQRKYLSDVVRAEILLETTWPERKNKWNPNIGITNSLGPLKTTSKSYVVVEDDVALVMERKRFVGRFLQSPSWVLFPFDVQKFAIKLTINDRSIRTVFKVDPKGTMFGALTVYSCLEPREYVTGGIEYHAGTDGITRRPGIAVSLPIYRNSFAYVPYFFYNFSIGCMTLMPYALQDSYCDHKLMCFVSLLTLFVVSEVKPSYLKPPTGEASYMDRYHWFVLAFLSLNYFACSIQTLALGSAEDGNTMFTRNEAVVIFPSGILYFACNIWFLAIGISTFRRLRKVMKNQH